MKKHYEPVAENILYPNYFGHISNIDVEYSSNGHDVQFILKSISSQSSHKIQTLAEYNSLLTDVKLKTTVQQLPIMTGFRVQPDRKILWILEAHLSKSIYVINCICTKCVSWRFLDCWFYNDMEQYVPQLYDSNTISNIKSCRIKMVYVFKALVWIWQITIIINGFGSENSTSTLYCTNEEVSTYTLTDQTHIEYRYRQTHKNMGIAIPSYNDEKSAALTVSDTVVELSLCCCKTGCIYSKKMYRLKKTPLCTEMFLCANCPK